MDIDLAFDNQKQILIVTVKDELIESDVYLALKEMVSSIIYPPDVDALWDLRTVNFKLTTEELAYRLRIVREGFPERGSANIAFVVSDELGFGMTRMHDLMAYELPQNVHIFKEYDEAINWLCRR